MKDTLSSLLPDDVEGLARDLLERSNALRLTLATAESCTGGLISSILTDVEGASHAFERGFTVYSDEAKSELLGIPPDQIKRCGAVSREIVIAMAEGALAHSHADIVLAVTGFAGPAGPDDETGLVHFACGRRGRQIRHHEAHYGHAGRSAVRAGCVRTGLKMMIEALEPPHSA